MKAGRFVSAFLVASLGTAPFLSRGQDIPEHPFSMGTDIPESSDPNEMTCGLPTLDPSKDQILQDEMKRLADLARNDALTENQLQASFDKITRAGISPLFLQVLTSGSLLDQIDEAKSRHEQKEFQAELNPDEKATLELALSRIERQVSWRLGGVGSAQNMAGQRLFLGSDDRESGIKAMREALSQELDKFGNVLGQSIEYYPANRNEQYGSVIDDFLKEHGGRRLSDQAQRELWKKLRTEREGKTVWQLMQNTLKSEALRRFDEAAAQGKLGGDAILKIIRDVHLAVILTVGTAGLAGPAIITDAVEAREALQAAELAKTLSYASRVRSAMTNPFSLQRLRTLSYAERLASGSRVLASGVVSNDVLKTLGAAFRGDSFCDWAHSLITGERGNLLKALRASVLSFAGLGVVNTTRIATTFLRDGLVGLLTSTTSKDRHRAWDGLVDKTSELLAKAIRAREEKRRGPGLLYKKTTPAAVPPDEAPEPGALIIDDWDRRLNQVGASPPPPEETKALIRGLTYEYLTRAGADLNARLSILEDSELRAICSSQKTGYGAIALPEFQSGLDLPRLCRDRFPADSGRSVRNSPRRSGSPKRRSG